MNTHDKEVMTTGAHDGEQSVDSQYHQPEVYELGALEKLQAYIMNGYPDGWRGYYSYS